MQKLKLLIEIIFGSFLIYKVMVNAFSTAFLIEKPACRMVGLGL